MKIRNICFATMLGVLFLNAFGESAVADGWRVDATRDTWPRQVVKDTYGSGWTTTSKPSRSSAESRPATPTRSPSGASRAPSSYVPLPAPTQAEGTSYLLVVVLGWGALASFWALRTWVGVSRR